MFSRWNLPGPVAFLIWLLVVVFVIIILALVIHALGGFMWDLHIGHFVLNLGVT